MADTGIYNLILLLLLAVYAIIRMAFWWKYRESHRKLKINKRTVFDTVLRYQANAVSFGLITLYFLGMNSGYLQALEPLRLMGVMIGIFAILMLLWVHKTLGDNWSPTLEVRESHKLITQGLYRYVRHPMYLCFYLFIISIGLITANLLVLLGMTLSMTILFVGRVYQEEALMRRQFGKAYDDYSKSTGVLLPKLRIGL